MDSKKQLQDETKITKLLEYGTSLLLEVWWYSFVQDVNNHRITFSYEWYNRLYIKFDAHEILDATFLFFPFMDYFSLNIRYH